MLHVLPKIFHYTSGYGRFSQVTPETSYVCRHIVVTVTKCKLNWKLLEQFIFRLEKKNL